MVQMLTLFSPIAFRAANIYLESDSGSAMNKGRTIYKERLFGFVFFFFFNQERYKFHRYLQWKRTTECFCFLNCSTLHLSAYLRLGREGLSF